MKTQDFKFIARRYTKKSVFVFFLLLFSVTFATAQQMEHVYGEYTFPVGKGSDIGRRQAEKEAVERAKIDAIGKMFGTNVSEHTILHKTAENEKVSVGFYSYGGTEVNGEWIRDSIIKIHEPYTQAGIVFYKAEVWGVAQKITEAGVDFSAKLLRNGTESKHEDSEFKNGDDIYLLFRSPAEGYLAVYLIDDAGKAFCILPYDNDPSGRAVHVRADKDYIFFSEKHAAPAEKNIVTEYTLTCDKSMEYNTVYVIFSPNPFTKANTQQRREGIPSELSLPAFQRWMQDNKNRDKNMKVVQRGLTITKKQE